MRLLAVAFAAWAAVTACAATDEGEAEETRICPGCGAEIPASSVFCPNCHRYLPDAKIEQAEPRSRETEAAPVVEPARRRFAGYVLGGMMVGSDNTDAYGLWGVLGIRATDLTIIGPGVGYQGYENGESIPIYFNLRRYLSRSTNPALIYFRLGYNKAWFKNLGFPFTGEEDPSGTFFGGGLGLDLLHKRGVGFTAEVGGRAEITNRFYVFKYPGGRFSSVMKQQLTLGLFRLAVGASF